LSLKKFVKTACSSPDDVLLLYYHSPTSPVYIHSTTLSSIDSVNNEILTLLYLNSNIPPKYMDYMSTVFSPGEFEKLPPHCPYDVDIKLEDGKTPPFGSLYHLTPPEHDMLTEYINKNLR
jgi:hypothetical protein